MAKSRVLPILLAAVLTVCSGTAAFPVAAFAGEQPAEQEEIQPAFEPESEQPASEPGSEQPAEQEEIQPASEPELEQPASEPESEKPDEEPTSEQPDVEPNAEQPAEDATPEKPAEDSTPEKAEEQLTVTPEKAAAAAQPATQPAAQPTEEAEEHKLAFASDYHRTEGSIKNAMEGMPDDVEYVSLIGDMVGERGGDHPEYKSEEILELVQEVFPLLNNSNVSIVWGSHDASVDDSGTGIVKCMDGVSEPIREGTNSDGSPAYYIYGIGHYDMTSGAEISAGAAAAFKEWVSKINHTIPVIVLCHVPIQALRGDNNGASYWNEALNFAATGVEGISTTETTADIVRNVLFLHGHNHTNDQTEYYFGAGTQMSVQVDKSSEPRPTPTPGQDPSERPPRARAEGVLSNIYYTSLTAGYLKTSGNATLLTIADGMMTLTKYNGFDTVSLGENGVTEAEMPDSITIAAQRHVAGAADMENIVPATCERAGSYDLVVRCTICGEEMLSTHVITDLAAHSWGKWVVTRGATEAAEGEETRTCSVCGQTQTRPIPKLSPEDEDSSKEDSSKEDSSKKGTEDREDSKRDNTAASTVSKTAPSPKTAASPKTGDEDQRMLWLIALQMSMVCCAACVAQRCARRQRKGAGQSE